MSGKLTPCQLWWQLGWIRMHSRLPLTSEQVRELRDAEDHLRSYQHVLDATLPSEVDAVGKWLAEERETASPEAEAVITQASLLLAAVRGLQGRLDEQTKALLDTRRELDREKHLHNYYYQSREGFQQRCVESANKFADERDAVKRDLAEAQTEIAKLRLERDRAVADRDAAQAACGRAPLAPDLDVLDPWGLDGDGIPSRPGRT